MDPPHETHVLIQGLSANLVSLRLLVLESQLSTGEAIDCPMLLETNTDPLRPTLRVIAQTILETNGGAFDLDNLPTDQPLVFFADAFDRPQALGNLQARGCTDRVRIPPGGTANVTLVLNHLP